MEGKRDFRIIVVSGVDTWPGVGALPQERFYRRLKGPRSLDVGKVPHIV